MIEFRYSFVGFWFSHLKKDLNLGPEIDKKRRSSIRLGTGTTMDEPWLWPIGARLGLR